MQKKKWIITLFIIGLLCFYLLWLSLEISASKNIAVINSQQKPAFVFVILSHVRDQKDQFLWKRCHHSVRTFYPQAPIVIIDDNSTIPLSQNALNNTTFIRSQYPGAGEILPYYYFLQYRWANKMIFLHDSMFLKRAFYQHELNNQVKFHWHFEYHNYDDDHLINMLLSHLKESQELIDFNTNQKALWSGCFGSSSIIDLSVLEEMEKKYSLTNSLKNIINSRDQRCAFERIFGLIFFKEQNVNQQNCSNFGSIRQYPYAFSPVDEETLKKVKLSYPGAILKTWHGR